jgi:branched-chain amino acid transport system substrate-binding protein
MHRKISRHAARTALSRRSFTAGAAATATLLAAPAIVRAQGGALKVGVLLPRSGFEASIGQDCYRGVEIAPPILKSKGLPELTVMNADTEQKGIPLVINIAAAPQITEQGYKFVFRNFPTAAMILGDAFENQKEIFASAGVAPKTAVYMHVNDTFGTAMSKGVGVVMPKFNMPYTIAETIPYDPTARDLSVEVAKAKAANPEVLLVTSRLNDAMLITRELVKQRWTPQAILSMGPGWYEDQYLKTLGKLSDGPIGFNPWQDPNKKLTPVLEAALAKAYPGVNLTTNHVFTFEAMLIAADAYKRAGSSDPKALADALRTTNITDNVSIGPGITFNAKGQNEHVKDEWPMKPYDKR